MKKAMEGDMGRKEGRRGADIWLAYALLNMKHSDTENSVFYPTNV